MRHPRLIRWLPAVAAPVLIAAGVVAVPLVADAAQPLPAKTPEQVLQLAEQARSVAGFTGTVQQTSDLGLPSLPTTGAGSDSQTASSLNLLTGTHRAQVWSNGRDQQRVAVLDSMGERDVVRDGGTLWTWDSAKRTASETTLAARSESTPTTPTDVATRFLDEVGPSTTVTVDRDTVVASRGAYTLVLTPKTDATTIGSVRIAVDAVTGLPLSVEVLARGAGSPAFDTAFTTISIGAQPASEFSFTPPSGATVERRTVTRTDVHRPTLAAQPTVSGSGWSSVLEVPAADVPSDIADNATVQRLSQATSGGRLLSTSLVNVLLTSDGRVLAGAVPASTLESLAAEH